MIRRNIYETIFIISYDTKEISGLPDGELAYECNGNTIVWFEFDESNLVKKIALTWEL